MINPKYEYLREYVERIPKDFETIGTVIHSGRNLIKMITVDGLDINVKRYTIPPLINRIAYAFFRPSKGKRAFVYPEKLLEKGFVKIHRVIFDRTSEIFRCYVLDFADVTHCKVCHAVTFSANEMVMRGSISIEPVRAISCCKTLDLS